LNNLYKEVIEVDEADLNIFTDSDLEEAIQMNDIENIIRSLDTLPYQIGEDIVGWFVEKLVLLSAHPHIEVRRSVAEASNSLTDFFTINNQSLGQLSDRFLKDQDMDIQYFGSQLKEKMQ
jgi:hypothetical protein